MKVLSTVVMCCVVSAAGFAQQASTAKPADTPSSTTTKPAETKTTSPEAAPKEKPPEHPCTEAQVREYLSETGGEQAAHVIMMNMARTTRVNAPPYFPPEFWKDMVDAFQKADLVPVFLPVYQQHISEEEMAQVLDFYRTPTGKHFLSLQPVMAADAQRLLAQQGKDIGHDIYLKYRDQIEAGKKQFEAQQGSSDAAPATKPARTPGTGASRRSAPASSTRTATTPAVDAPVSPAPATPAPAVTPDSTTSPK